MTTRDQFAEALATMAAGLRVGDPMDPGTDIGPLIHPSAAIRVEAAIAEAVAKGATLHTGGTRQGAVIAPTVLSNVGHGLPLYCAEVFAPVVLVEPFDDLGEALDVANSTPSPCRQRSSPVRWPQRPAASVNCARAVSS